MKCEAGISADKLYRYTLSRVWDESLPLLGWIGYNPSIADGSIDDPSVRRMMTFSADSRHGGLLLGNLHGLISTDPKQLLNHPDPIGPNNLAAWTSIKNQCPHVVAAWGAAGLGTPQSLKAIEMFPALWCLGTTKHGAPRHPLYIKSSQPLVRFRRRP